MNLDSKRLALAAAILTAVIWIVSSTLVALAPRPAMEMTEHMVRANLSNVSWSLTWGAFFVGLVS